MTVFRGLIGCVLAFTAAMSFADDKTGTASPVRVDVRVVPESEKKGLSVQVHVVNLTDREVFVAHPLGDIAWHLTSKDFTEQAFGGHVGSPLSNKRLVYKLGARVQTGPIDDSDPVVNVASSMVLSWPTDKVLSNEQYSCHFEGFIVLMPDGKTTDIDKGKAIPIDVKIQFGGPAYSTEAESM